MPARCYRLLDLTIDTAAQRVTRAGQPIVLAGLSFQLLAYLLTRQQDVVSFDAMIAAVWAPAIVNEETVTQRIKLLRQALGDDGRQPRYIRSVRGRGYQLCEMPEVLDPAIQPPSPAAPTATAAIAESPSAGAVVRPSQRWLARGRLVAVALVATVVLGTAWWLRPARMITETSASTPDLASRAAYYAGIGQHDNNERAIGLYQQALAANPADPRALTGLSRAYSARVCLYNASSDWLGQAHDLAARAQAADPRNARAWSALAYAADCGGRIDDAIDAYEHAFALDPGDDASRSSAAYLYQEKGRIADALRANMQLHGDPQKVRFREVQIARAFELLGFDALAQTRYGAVFQLNPDNIFANIAWPRFLFVHDQASQAQAALHEALARHTERADLYLLAGELALRRGAGNEARSAFQDALQLRSQASLPATLAGLYAAGGVDPAWLQQRLIAVRQGLDGTQTWPAQRLELVLLELAAGARPAALHELARAVADGYSDAAYLRSTPLLQALRGESEFARIVQSIDTRMAEQRRQVLAADWCPVELKAVP